MSKFLKSFFVCMTAVLAACGGGGSDSGAPASAAPQEQEATKLVVIGNSLTRHPPAPQYGWLGDWGMAASAKEKDFAHMTAAALGVPVVAQNFAEVEREPSKPNQRVAEIAGTIDETTDVVVQLGNNAQSEEFNAAYSNLVSKVAHGRRLVCVSVWGGHSEFNKEMQKSCQQVGGRFVDIGDLYDDPANTDRKEKLNDAIDSHPHNWGMAKIAERIIPFLK